MEKKSSGKVRDIYEVDDNTLMIVVSDRISAFDFIMPDPIPDKGKILNRMSAFWFDYTKDVVKNHLLTTHFDAFPPDFKTEAFRDRSMLVRKLKMLPVECIVRGYISGSGWSEYEATGCIAGTPLPTGLRESERLPTPLFTPSTKADLGDHDESITFERACGLLGADLAVRVRDTAIAVYEKCAAYALERGIIIADTKFEFGLDDAGNLVLGDEALTPDSSRFWPLEGYEVGRGQNSFDKQYLRDWLERSGYRSAPPPALPGDVIEMTRHKYLEAYEKLTGRTL